MDNQVHIGVGSVASLTGESDTSLGSTWYTKPNYRRLYPVLATENSLPAYSPHSTRAGGLR